MSTPTKSQVYSINHIGEDGIIRCYCDEPAPLRTSRTNANPNRDFYACNKDREDPGRCKFWSEHIFNPEYMINADVMHRVERPT